MEDLATAANRDRARAHRHRHARIHRWPETRRTDSPARPQSARLVYYGRIVRDRSSYNHDGRETAAVTKAVLPEGIDRFCWRAAPQGIAIRSRAVAHRPRDNASSLISQLQTRIVPIVTIIFIFPSDPIGT